MTKRSPTHANKPDRTQPSLALLTGAALLLPGLLQSGAAHAEDDDEVDFGYSHYQEGKRNLFGGVNDLNPIEVEGIYGRAKISLSDRIKFGFNFTQDTWGGATPRINTPIAAENTQEIVASASPLISPITVKIDEANHIMTRAIDPTTGEPLAMVRQNTRWIHTLAAASPETRKQGDFNLRYQWDEAEVSAGGGVSLENDYESRFGNLGLRKDFNQKQTSVILGLSYTNSDTTVGLGQLDLKFIDSSHYIRQMDHIVYGNDNHTLAKSAVLHGNRQDWGATLGLTQILNKDALVSAGVAYTRSSGYLANPYKSVMIEYIDPRQMPDADGLRTATFKPVLEKRPEERNQLSWSTRYVQHLTRLGAALHLGYNFAHDDWGIHAHTFDADWVQPLGSGWTITPRVRYYSQGAADFYGKFFVVNQAYTSYGTHFNLPYDPARYPDNYSSDQRLSAYGTLSGGVTVSKQFNKALSLETGFEYYTHAGGLKLGGGGEGQFADFSYFVANAALKLNLSALGSWNSGGGAIHTHLHPDNAPAGVLFSHMLEQSDSFMVGYRYMRSRDAGGMLHGDHGVGDAAVVGQGCPVDSAGGCRMTATEMTMNMHMLDLMYAPTDWLNLMLMPQFVDSEMALRPLAGAPADIAIGHHGDGAANQAHSSGGVGDTGLYALFKLFKQPGHQAHLALGLSAPTGDVGVRLRRLSRQDIGFAHYGMQLGSGTWDFKPSLTYTGKADAWGWGGQLSGTKRLQDRNQSGYALGDLFQTTAWGSYDLTHWLSASVRGVYSWHGAVRHQFIRDPIAFDHCNTADFIYQDSDPETGEPIGEAYLHQADYDACVASVAETNNHKQRVQDSLQRSTPMDHPSNYGGHYVDLGLGLNLTIPDGSFAGHRLSFEWLQPVYTNVNGYQLERDGALSVNWSVPF